MMPASFAEEIAQKIDQAVELYHRLVIVVAPAGAGKTEALRDIHARAKVPLVNVNLEISSPNADLHRAPAAATTAAHIV